MKKLLFICSIILISGCEITYEKKQEIEIDASVNITKIVDGYNIYSNKGELILEFTKQNCDSASLETLEYIYSAAKEFYNKEIPKEEKNIKTIAYERPKQNRQQ